MPTCYKCGQRETVMQCICRDCTKPSVSTEKGELTMENIVRPETGDSIKKKASVITTEEKVNQIMSSFKIGAKNLDTALTKAEQIRETCRQVDKMLQSLSLQAEDSEIKVFLEKQMALLSQKSQGKHISADELATLSKTMAEVAMCLRRLSHD